MQRIKFVASLFLIYFFMTGMVIKESKQNTDISFFTNQGGTITKAIVITGTSGTLDAQFGFASDSAMYATASVPGIVSTTTQTFSGNKTFTGVTELGQSNTVLASVSTYGMYAYNDGGGNGHIDVLTTGGGSTAFIGRVDNAGTFTQWIATDATGQLQIGPPTTHSTLTQTINGATINVAGDNVSVNVIDTQTETANDGGAITFFGAYNGNTTTSAGLIKAEKNNSTAGDFGYAMTFRTRQNGSGGASEALLLDSNQNATFRGTLTPVGGIVGNTSGLAATGNVGEFFGATHAGSAGNGFYASNSTLLTTSANTSLLCQSVNKGLYLASAALVITPSTSGITYNISLDIGGTGSSVSAGASHTPDTNDSNGFSMTIPMTPIEVTSNSSSICISGSQGAGSTTSETNYLMVVRIN